MNPDDILHLMIIVHQIDDQPLRTTPYGEEAFTLFSSSKHVEGREILDPTSIKNEYVAGLKTQDNTSTSYYQLRGGHR